MTVTGPTSTALQVRDVERAAAFYETHLGLRRAGLGVALWLHADDAQAQHDALVAAGVPIVGDPFDGPFGRTSTSTDLDGYAITLHDRA